MSNIFVCYDKKQRNFFRDKGFHDSVKGLHEKTLNPFWVFERNEIGNENKTFGEVIREWKDNKS